MLYWSILERSQAGPGETVLMNRGIYVPEGVVY